MVVRVRVKKISLKGVRGERGNKFRSPPREKKEKSESGSESESERGVSSK